MRMHLDAERSCPEEAKLSAAELRRQEKIDQSASYVAVVCPRTYHAEYFHTKPEARKSR
jgi:hypothetical protein